jgi:hypothetical protein
MRRFFGLTSVFVLCFLLDFFIPQSSLAIPFVGFSPFLATLLGRSSKPTLLIMAALCGLCHDLFTLQHRLGVSALAYLIATALNLVFRRKYYEENLIPFFGITFFLSLSYSLFFLIFGAFKGLVITTSFKMILYQLVLYPLFDATVGLVGVFIPVKVYTLIKHRFLIKQHEF